MHLKTEILFKIRSATVARYEHFLPITFKPSRQKLQKNSSHSVYDPLKEGTKNGVIK